MKEVICCTVKQLGLIVSVIERNGLDLRVVGEEGDAIFTWAIKGGELLAKDIKAIGDFILSDDQKAKVQRIVDDSGSLRLFVETCLEKPGGGSFGGLSTTEIVDAYNGFWRHREFEVQPDAVTQKKLPDLMMEIHGLPKGKKVSGPDGRSKQSPAFGCFSPYIHPA